MIMWLTDVSLNRLNTPFFPNSEKKVGRLGRACTPCLSVGAVVVSLEGLMPGGFLWTAGLPVCDFFFACFFPAPSPLEYLANFEKHTLSS